MSRLSDLLWGRLTQTCAVPRDSLRILRPVVCVFLLLAAAPNFGWLDSTPRGLFDPPRLGIANVVGMPPSPFFAALDGSIVLAIVGVMFGVAQRTLTWALVAANIVGISFAYTFGKIDHTQVFLLVVLASMAYCDWGESLQEEATAQRRCDVALAVAGGSLAFGFATAAVPKLLSWVDLNLGTSGILSWYFPGRVELWRTGLLTGATSHIPVALLELLDVVAPLFELAAVAAVLWSRRAWLGYLVAASFFHLANVLLLEIPFVPQAFLYVVFVDLTRHRVMLRRVRVAMVGIGLAAALWHLVGRATGTSSATAFVADAIDQLHAVQLTAIVVAPVISLLALLELNSLRRIEAERPATDGQLGPST